MSSATVTPGRTVVNLAPEAYRRWALHYYQCRTSVPAQSDFTPVPFFLLCRAIELQLKSHHLEKLSQDEVKDKFDHNLEHLYDQLPAGRKVLSTGELKVLRQANSIYRDKGFEYFDSQDALNAYRRFPDIATLDIVAQRILGI